MFQLGTHRVVPIPDCSIHHPLINRVVAVVRRSLVDADVSSYAEAAHAGLARYLQVVVERSTQTAQVVLVANSPTAAPLAACLDLIRERLGDELHSLWFNTNCERSNTILGTDFQHWCGPATVIERFAGAAVHYPPGAFGQSNLDIAERIVEHVRARVPEGARVTEFYAGVGAIGLSLLPGVSELRMNEVSPHSLQGMALGLADLDPPRKGLDQELLEYLCEHSPERLIYVSCGLESLQRDVANLAARGRLRLVDLAAFNLMPFTEHVETVACFERA